jgi:HEAT repeat protein
MRSLIDTFEKAVRLRSRNEYTASYGRDVERILANCRVDLADILVERWSHSDLAMLRNYLTYALGNMRIQRAIPILAQMLISSNEESFVRRGAALALGNIGGELARATLSKYQREAEISAGVEIALGSCLDTIEDVDVLEREATMVLNMKDSEAWMAFRAMGLSRDKRFVERLLHALDDGDHTVRAASALALARITQKEHLARLKRCRMEASTPLERIHCSLAVIVASEYRVEPSQLNDLRNNLGIESYMYKRQIREDIVRELSITQDENARRVSSCWAKVYETGLDY